MSSPGPTAGKHAPFEIWTIRCHRKGNESNAHNKVWHSLVNLCSNSNLWCHMDLLKKKEQTHQKLLRQIAFALLGSLEMKISLVLLSRISSPGGLPGHHSHPFSSAETPLFFVPLSALRKTHSNTNHHTLLKGSACPLRTGTLVSSSHRDDFQVDFLFRNKSMSKNHLARAHEP